MKTLIAILVVFFLSQKSFAQNSEDVQGKIITENHGDLLQLKAVAINSSDLYRDLNYILISLKKGKSGTSTNKQSGKFSLRPNDTQALSEVRINLQKNDGLKVFLFLKDEKTDHLVSKDSLEINAAQFSAEINYIPEKQIELSGLTVDDTKTRIGQMFYESFFKKYNQIPKKYTGTITVAEMPTIGRSSRITVSIDDQIIYAFMSKPDEDAAEQEAERALAYLAQYEQRNALRDKEFKY
ncbi:curli-like amyloid fiber formation chaperone CsgH [Kaistella palustris]|uniref:curli-like amyloid fiber formation chaperone CsgH n=1 Tax=Kaistella palustris TaxID=493376 RepID=UPI0006851F20|nr:curli-like amyloid fiber formation chaperone CsgH [Kaistella palustris]